MKARSNAAPRAPSGPFSRPLNVETVHDGGLERAIEANLAECAAIAVAADLPAVAALTAKLVIERRAGGLIEVTGNLVARVTQICVVSLDPFDSEIRREIEISFAPEPRALPEIRGTRAGRAAERQAPPPPPVAGNDDQEDPPDPIVDDTIDLGAIAVEFLILALDPYPKKPDARFTDLVAGEEEDARPSPFAALADLKARS